MKRDGGFDVSIECSVECTFQFVHCCYSRYLMSLVVPVPVRYIYMFVKFLLNVIPFLLKCKLFMKKILISSTPVSSYNAQHHDTPAYSQTLTLIPGATHRLEISYFTIQQAQKFIVPRICWSVVKSICLPSESYSVTHLAVQDYVAKKHK